MDNLSNPEVGANTSAAKARARRDEITRQERHDMVWLRDAVLPDDEPPDDIYRLAVPILCEMNHEDLVERLGPEYACGVVSAGCKMSAAMEPRIQYAKTSDGVNIAYATAGNGPLVSWCHRYRGQTLRLS